MDVKTSFDILDLGLEADASQAKRAYKDQVRRWHPDRFPEGSAAKAEAEERLKQVNIAYARVKSYLAMRRPDPRVAAENAPTHTHQDAAGPHESSGETSKKRSWFDHLFDTLSAFAGSAGESRKAQTEESNPHRRRTFGQVLDEVAGGNIASPSQRPAGHAGACRRSAAGYGRRRGSGTGVGSVGGMERTGPVKPVGRVRGIGSSR